MVPRGGGRGPILSGPPRQWCYNTGFVILHRTHTLISIHLYKYIIICHLNTVQNILLYHKSTFINNKQIINAL